MLKHNPITVQIVDVKLNQQTMENSTELPSSIQEPFPGMFDYGIWIACHFLFLGFFGNLFSIKVLTSANRLQSTHYKLVINAVMSDIMITGILLPVFIAEGYAGNSFVSSTWCPLERLLLCLCLTCKSFSSFIIPFERYSLMRMRQSTHHVYFASRTVILVAILPFIISLVFGTPIFLNAGVTDVGNEVYFGVCLLENFSVINSVFQIIYLSASCFLPLLIGLILFIIVMQSKFTIENSGSKWSFWHFEYARITFNQNMSIVVSSFKVYLPNLCSCFLFGISVILSLRHLESSATIMKISLFLLFLNSALSSVLYGLTYRTIRKVYQQATMYCTIRSVHHATISEDAGTPDGTALAVTRT